MKAFFSKRHEHALAMKELGVTFGSRCRFAVERVLQQHSDWGGYDNSDNFTFEGAEADLITFYGESTLWAYDKKGQYTEASISQLILSGRPAHVLDVIEAWFYQNPKRMSECEKELNDIFFINDSPWRVVNGNVILVDSDYLHREVRAKGIRLLAESDIPGALEEYQGAIDDLTSGETKDAVSKAHKSVESVMKAVLETDEHMRYGQLLSKLIKSGVIPKYYEDFLKHFEQLALGVVKERNLPGRGHGQGRETKRVTRSLAEFAVNLAGAINVFIIKHSIETKQAGNDKEHSLSEDDVPF